MFRHLIAMLLASWITAALTVSPLVASLNCRQCCDSAQALRVDDHACGHHRQGDAPTCCQEKTAPPVPDRGPCDECPRCASVRPVTAVISPAFDWKLPSDFVSAILPPPVDAGTVVLLDLNSAREVMVDLGTPPPRILLCVWRE